MTTAPPRRPSMGDPELERAAAVDLLPRIIEWMGKNWREDDREDVIDDLMSIANEFDGYSAARALESRSMWQCDAELVDILDGGISHNLMQSHARAVRAWVDANRITAKLFVGQIVKTTYGVGPIVGVDEKQAVYTVRTDRFLKEHPGQTGATGFVVPFESCEDADA